MKENKIIFSVILLLSIILIIFYFFENNQRNNFPAKTQSNLPAESKKSPVPESVEIKLDARRYFYNPRAITVKKGQRVKITVNNIDTLHGISLPDFGVSDKDSVEFVANRTGDFIFRCIVDCGEDHMAMIGILTITE